MNKVDFMPEQQRVLVLPDIKSEEKTVSGIIIPNSVKEDKPETGMVVRVGLGEKDRPMAFQVGQRILFSNYAGIEVELNLFDAGKHTYKVMNQMDVMGVIKDKE